MSSATLSNHGGGGGGGNGGAGTSAGGNHGKRGRFDMFAPRPNIGTSGYPIVILSNHYGVSYDLNKTVYSYYVNINQVNGNASTASLAASTSSFHKSKTETIFRNVMKWLIENNSQVGNIFHKIACIFDGTSCLYTSERLPIISDKTIKFRVNLADSSPEYGSQDYNFEVCIKLVNVLSLQSIKDYYQNPVNDAHIETIRSINLVVRHLFLSMRFLVGRSSFHSRHEDDTRQSISALKEISYGPCSAGLQLILDRSCAPFMKPLPVDQCIRVFMRDIGSQRWSDFARKKLELALKDYFFEVTHLAKSRKYKISGITLEPASRITFESNQDGGRTISVADYFSKTYGPLRHPDMACVKVRKMKNDFIYFPAEVCRITTDQRARKLTIKEKADMIRSAASVVPAERFEIIRSTARDLMDRDKMFNYLRDFGINIATQPVAIKARVLAVPKLLEGNGGEVKPSGGKWHIKRFFQPANINQWVLVVMGRFEDPVLDRFVDTLIRHGRELGMAIKPPKKVRYNFDPTNLANFFAKSANSFGKVDLYFFVGCEVESQYNAIKKAGDVDLGVATQCMRPHNVLRFNQSIAVNILQKVNVKLGGINVSVAVDSMPPFCKANYQKTLVIGADVAHPSPTERGTPSLAAMVANCSPDFTRYCSSVKIQKFFRQEIIQELDQMLVDMLVAYEKKNNVLPDKIIFYRDGVSEGQFRTVFDEEVRVIKDVLAKYRPGYKARLSFCVVLKRHHSRFMPDNARDGVGKSCNVPPGTVVDHDVVHPRNFDFFLCSHAGIQGTSRPSHYCVLLDENQLKADELQDFTNMLCHLYGRCSRSISIPTPVYYAHLAAFRARAHISSAISLQREMGNMGGDRMSMGGGPGGPGRQGMEYFAGPGGANGGGGFNGAGPMGGQSRVHYTKHHVPSSSIDNFDVFIDMPLESRCSMYYC
ncbi:Protein argonaute-2 [Tyrophagus putrescentiae]|nr:Protein argonaute-2 [Tyrophagus putrescentiae]